MPVLLWFTRGTVQVHWPEEFFLAVYQVRSSWPFTLLHTAKRTLEWAWPLPAFMVTVMVRHSLSTTAETVWCLAGVLEVWDAPQ